MSKYLGGGKVSGLTWCGLKLMNVWRNVEEDWGQVWSYVKVTDKFL